MKAIYTNLGFIIAFLCSIMFLSMFAGDKFTEKYLLLVLFGMMLYNSDAFNSFLKKSFTLKAVEETETTGTKGGTTVDKDGFSGSAGKF